MSKHPHRHDHAKPQPFKPHAKQPAHPAAQPPAAHDQPQTAHGQTPPAHGEAPAANHSPHKLAPPPPMETGGCAMRLLWMFVGNAALGISAIQIAKSHDGFLSLWDLVFWLIAPGLVALRYVDITRFKGTTAVGTPATLDHWKRYVKMLIPAAIVIWAAAHGLEPLLR